VKGLREYRYLLWLLLPLALYLVPLVLGYSWNSLAGPNALNPPEGYDGRLPTLPVTAETWGTSVVIVPFRARLREFFWSLTLPLWNPYQGLGQVFAAQGEGSPYFPLAIIRALLPYSWSNWLILGSFVIGGLAVSALLREIGLSRRGVLFGGIAFLVSGILTVQIPRENIADQLCMAPVLFWATVAAVRTRTTARYAILAVVSALHALAGFIQVGMLATLLAVLLAVVYAWAVTASAGPSSSPAEPPRAGAWRGWPGGALAAIGAIGVGTVLAAFSILPMLDAMLSSHSQNLRLIFAAQPVPFGNVVVFFLPVAFGFPYWTNWATPTTTAAPTMASDWNDLFAYAGLTPMLLVVGGLTVRAWREAAQRTLFWLFSITALVLLLRYLSIPPFDLLDLVPPLALQTRKHANGLTVLLLILAAAIALDHVEQWRRRLALSLQAGACLVIWLLLVQTIARLTVGDFAIPYRLASVGAPFLAVSLLMTVLVLVPCILYAAGRLAPGTFAVCVTGLMVAEAVVYIPLGQNDVSALYPRVGLALLVVVGALLLATGRRRIAAVTVAVTVAGYGWLVASSSDGLARRFEADAPPPFMAWLHEHAGSEYRTFGIFPDFSSIDQIQDVGAIGPLAPPEFRAFVDIVSDDVIRQAYDGSPIFMLVGRIGMAFDQYQTTRPVFDWLGVRYIVLERGFRNPDTGQDEQILLSDTSNFRLAYQDDRVVIVESVNAAPKAELWLTAQSLPVQPEIVSALRREPGLVRGPPIVEGADVDRLGLPPPRPGDSAQPVQVDAYMPNRVTMTVDASARGLVVLKDAYAAGWAARVDGEPTPLVRVNGMVRGILIPSAGRHQIEVMYQPVSFQLGAALAGLTAALVLVLLALGLRRPTAPLPAWAMAAGVVVGVAFVVVVGGLVLRRPKTETLASASAGAGQAAAAFDPSPSLARFPWLAGATAVHGSREGRLQAGDAVTVLALSSSSLAGTSPDDIVQVSPGDLVLRADGTLQRVARDGSWTDVEGDVGQRIRLANVGPWSVERRAFDGVDAVFDGKRWVIDASAMRPANLNPTLRQGNSGQDAVGQDSAPGTIPYWSIVPNADAATVEWLADEAGPFVRVHARQDIGQIILQTKYPISDLDGVPVSVRAQLRLHGTGELHAGILDKYDDRPGVYRAHIDQSARRDAWVTLQIDGARIVYPSTDDVVFAGGFDLHAGDWFDVREVSVFVGTLPPGPYPTASATANGQPAGSSATGQIDLALGRQARQSRTVATGEAALAVDGGSASAATAQGQDGLPPWWEVDLGEVQRIDRVNVQFHPGCCGDGGQRGYLFVSDRPFESDDPAVTANDSSVRAITLDDPTGEVTASVGGVRGRYVRVQAGAAGMLLLDAVRVLAPPAVASPSGPGEPVNQALRRRTRQSSTTGQGSADFANDGRTDRLVEGRITQTRPEAQAWWEIDLGGSVDIDQIAIWNRSDCCQDWLQRFYVLVSDDPIASRRPALAAVQPGLTPFYVDAATATPTTIPIGRRGRYVRIQLTGSDSLTLGEVQVFGRR
jgi:hypothetical protein